MVESLKAAFDSLRSLEQSELLAVSPFYKSAPIDATGPDLVNAVAKLETALEPYGLLLHLLDIELMLGRKRRGQGQKNSPRNVDLDLLLLGDMIIQSTPLTCHTRGCTSAFVLKPLLDLAPEIRIPGRIGQRFPEGGLESTRRVARRVRRAIACASPASISTW